MESLKRSPEETSGPCVDYSECVAPAVMPSPVKILPRSTARTKGREWKMRGCRTAVCVAKSPRLPGTRGARLSLPIALVTTVLSHLPPSTSSGEKTRSSSSPFAAAESIHQVCAKIPGRGARSIPVQKAQSATLRLQPRSATRARTCTVLPPC